MAKRTPSQIRTAATMLKTFFLGSVVSSMTVIIADLGGAWVGYGMLFCFFGLPILAGIYESKYAARKLRLWTEALGGHVTQHPAENPDRIDIESQWEGVAVRWSIPSPLRLDNTPQGSMVWLEYGGSSTWPEDFMVQTGQDDSYGYALESRGPEDYRIAALTPDVRAILAALCDRYALRIENRRIHFDLRCTPRTTNMRALKKELAELMQLASRLSIHATEVPARLQTQYETELARLEGYPGPGFSQDPEIDQHRLDNTLTVLIRHHGHTEAGLNTARSALTSASKRVRMVAASAVLHRSARREKMPAAIVDDARTWMEHALDAMDPAAAPFADGLDAYLGHLGQKRGPAALEHSLKVVSAFADEEAHVAAVLLTYCALWSQWPDVDDLKDVISMGILSGPMGHQSLESLQAMCNEMGGQPLVDDLATACMNALAPLKEPRDAHSFQVEMALLKWIATEASLALAGPVDTFADTQPRLVFSLDDDEEEWAKRLAHEARRVRSSLVERYGDGGGRLSMLQDADAAVGAVSLSPMDDDDT